MEFYFMLIKKIINNIITETFCDIMKTRYKRAYVSLFVFIMSIFFFIGHHMQLSVLCGFISLASIMTFYSQRETLKWKEWLAYNYLTVFECVFYAFMFLLKGYIDWVFLILIFSSFKLYVTFTHDVLGTPYAKPWTRETYNDLKNELSKLKEIEEHKTEVE